mgnify:CR=1 FL=1
MYTLESLKFSSKKQYTNKEKQTIMARGKKAKQDRKSVRSIPIQIRLNEYELEELMVCLDTLKDERPISTFIRDLINSKVKDMSKDIKSS